MKKINEENITSVIKTCCTKPSYQVIIATKTSEEAEQIFENVISEQAEIQQYISKASRSHFNIFIEFKNSSYIRFIKASENNRGFACHELLYDPAIEQNLINDILPSLEKMKYQYTEVTAEYVNEIFSAAKEFFCNGIYILADEHPCGWDFISFEYMETPDEKIELSSISNGIYDYHSFHMETLFEILKSVGLKGWCFEISGVDNLVR